MYDPTAGAAINAAADPTVPRRSLTFEHRWAASTSEQLERTRLIEQARHTDAAERLRRCCPSAVPLLEQLSWRALTRLAANQPVDPTDPDSWRSPDAHAQIVLRRHGITGLDSTRLTMEAVRRLIDGQARADREAGLDWTRLDVPPAQLHAALRRAHAQLPIALDDPAIYAYRDDQRRALAARLGVAGEQAGDLSRWLLGHPDAFEAADLRCWRIASATWLALASEQLSAVELVERPVGLFLAPAERGEGWQLAPVLSLDAIRLLHSLGGRVEYDLRSAVLPLNARTELLERLNRARCTPGRTTTSTPPPGSPRRSRASSGAAVSPGVAREQRDRWGPAHVPRRAQVRAEGRRGVGTRGGCGARCDDRSGSAGRAPSPGPGTARRRGSAGLRARAGRVPPAGRRAGQPRTAARPPPAAARGWWP